MKIEIEECLGCNKSRPIVNRKNKLCNLCNKKRLGTDKKEAPLKPKKVYELKRTPLKPKSSGLKSNSKPIKQVSSKQQKRLTEYNKVATEYKKSNPICERCLIAETSDIHHRKGRVGELLSDSKWFMAVCRPCHNWIEVHPEESRRLGYSLSRLSIEN